MQLPWGSALQRTSLHARPCPPPDGTLLYAHATGVGFEANPMRTDDNERRNSFQVSDVIVNAWTSEHTPDIWRSPGLGNENCLPSRTRWWNVPVFGTHDRMLFDDEKVKPISMVVLMARDVDKLISAHVCSIENTVLRVAEHSERDCTWGRWLVVGLPTTGKANLPIWLSLHGAQARSRQHLHGRRLLELN